MLIRKSERQARRTSLAALATQSKAGLDRRDLRTPAPGLTIPVVAIGGLDAAGAVRAASAGAAMVAVIGALVAASPAEIRGRVVDLVRALAAN